MSLDKTLFPDGWKVVPISDVVFFQEGPGVRRFQYTDSGVKLLNGGNINKGILNLSTTVRYISDDEAYGKYNHFLVEEGDLLIACSGVVVEKFDGKIAYARKEHLPLCMNTSTMRFRSLDRDILHLDYFRWFLTTTFFKRQLQQLITGSAQLNFGPSHIKLMSIPLPPLETQKQIAAVLEKADQLRKDCKLMEQELNSLAQSVFIDMFGDPVTNPKGWEVKAISSVVSDYLGGKSLVAADDESTVYINKILKISAITSGEFKAGEVKPLPNDYEPPVEHFVKKHDLLFSRANTTELVGATAMVFEEHENIVLPDKLWRFIWKDEDTVSPVFIWRLLSEQGMRREISKLSSGSGGSMKNISKGKLKTLPIILPPLDIQKKYEQFYLKLRSELLGNSNLVEQAETGFQALMQKAFKGELNLKTKAA